MINRQTLPDAPAAKAGGEQHISTAIAAVMQQVNIRTLVNGLDERVKESALLDLRAVGMERDEVVRQLRALTVCRDRNAFPAGKVEEAIAWLSERWNVKTPDTDHA